MSRQIAENKSLFPKEQDSRLFRGLHHHIGPWKNAFSQPPLSDRDIAGDFEIEIFEHLNVDVARDYIAELQHLRQEIGFLKSVSNQRLDLWSALWRKIGRLQNRTKCFILDYYLASLIPGRNRSKPGLFRRK